MALEVEEAFPSFSTERIRSKVQSREGPVTQRRLDYNVPLLSVRRLAADAGGDVRSKVWKLSGELSNEPLRVPGAVPFTWEHTPGQPKQPESPPQAPSSPSPPSTPSPPSARRASPASPNLPPPPPPLRPLFLRSNSSTLFAPPPPPPPPPPPLPCLRPLPLQMRRTAPHIKQPSSSSASPPPPPPPPPPLPPPPHPPTLSQVHKRASTAPVSQHLPDHERMGAFRLVDPTEGFLRLLRARREKAEPQEFPSAEVAGEAAEVSHKAAEDSSIVEVASVKDNSSCVAVDAIVQRFLAEHPDVVAEEASVERQDEEALLEDDLANLDIVNFVNLPCEHSKHDAEQQGNDAEQQGNDAIADVSNPCSIVTSKEDAALLVAPCDEASEEMPKGESTLPNGLASEYVPSPAGWENCGSVCVPVSPSTDPREVQLDAGHKQSLIKKQQNRRHTSSIAILDSCRVESLRMIKSTLLQLCRKAAAASMRMLAKAKQKVAISHCTFSSLEVVAHPNASRSSNHGRSDREEEAVVREAKTEVQERFSQETKHQEALVSVPHTHPIILPRSSTDILQESSETILNDEIDIDSKRGCTPISSPKPSSESGLLCATNAAEEKDILSSSPHCSPNNAESAWTSISFHKSATYENNEAKLEDIVSSPPQHSPNGEGSFARPRVCSARHVYAKSLGGDEPNEFYDASSRFGSRGSTPSRIHSNRSMSKDWFIPDDFLDATSSPFETPRTSVSDIRYSISNGEVTAFSPITASKVSRPTSKLSKRVGKSLWVDTRESNPVGKVAAVSRDELKGFMSGELYMASNENQLVLNKKEVNGARRKWVSGDQANTSTSDARRQWVSGDQANTSTSDARRQYKRDTSRQVNGKSIAVTPVFPSKCQKNRSIASASGLPQQILTGNTAEMGWPLGISGFPPLKVNTKMKEERKERGAAKGDAVPLPPLPPSPAGGSWLRKALSTNTQKQAPSGIASLHAVASNKVESSPSPGSKWEDIVKGSHVQPGHLRFSEELHHHPPSNATHNKYYVS